MDIFGKVKEIVVEQLGVDEEEVNEQASFVDDLGADSWISWNWLWLWKRSSTWKFRMRMPRRS